MREIFDENQTDAILLVDASNAFNSLNRQALLHNVQHVCPPMAKYVRNCYRTPSRLFVAGGKEIVSSEGTTQGDPFAMPSYAIGLAPMLPLLKREQKQDEQNDVHGNVKQAAYADDIGGAGILESLKPWWDIVSTGPLFGYFPKASKSWLVVKEDKFEEAKILFADTGINITTQGRKYLGGFIGRTDEIRNYQKKLVDEWIVQVKTLAEIAKSEPQAVYTAFIHGFRHKLSYFLRTIPNFSEALQRLDEVIDTKMLPSLLNIRHISKEERKLISLPSKFGGLGITIFSDLSRTEFENSKRISSDIAKNLKLQRETLEETTFSMKKMKQEIKLEKKLSYESILQDLQDAMTKEQKHLNGIARMKGASSSLTAIPRKDENTFLNKREFHVAIGLRYRWNLKYLPTTCACGKQFTIDHAMSCSKGCYIHQRHDEIRDLIGKIATEISCDVEIGPHLQELTGESLPQRSIRSLNHDWT